MSTNSGPEVRLLVIEDVAQVAQYIRTLLAAQPNLKLLDIVPDGSQAVGRIEQLKPDVVLVDLLLQGRVKGAQVVDQVRRLENAVPMIVLTVPQNPVKPAPEHGIFGVLMMPFSGYDLIHRIQDAHAAFRADGAHSRGRLISVYSPKGGVGKTTIAYNLAVAIGQLGQSTVLVDGSIQFGDLRRFLKVPADAPSMLNLPTDKIQDSDLRDVLWRDPSGIDILLAPPRVEMAEMVTARDMEKTLSLLRSAYRAVVIDTPSALGDICLGFLDASDTVLQVITADAPSLHAAAAVAEVFATIGYPAGKVVYLANRVDGTGGQAAAAILAALGRAPEFSVAADGPLVARCTDDGVPFVIARPDAPISLDVARMAAAVGGLSPALMAARR